MSLNHLHWYNLLLGVFFVVVPWIDLHCNNSAALSVAGPVSPGLQGARCLLEGVQHCVHWGPGCLLPLLPPHHQPVHPLWAGLCAVAWSQPLHCYSRLCDLTGSHWDWDTCGMSTGTYAAPKAGAVVSPCLEWRVLEGNRKCNSWTISFPLHGKRQITLTLELCHGFLVQSTTLLRMFAEVLWWNNFAIW